MMTRPLPRSRLPQGMPWARRWIAATLVAMLSFCCLTRGSYAADVSDETAAGSADLPNLSVARILPARAGSGFAEGRFFGGDEDLVYGGIGVGYGLGSGFEAGVRAVIADRKRLALFGGSGIDHGGTDVELLVRYGRPGKHDPAAQVGVSFADTPAQRDSFFTLGLSASARLSQGVAAVLNPRAVFIDGNTIVGIGVGASARLSNTLSLIGDWTSIVSGDNTRDTSTGSRKRRNIYGAALRYSSPNGRTTLDLGFANGTGRTTGASLTSGLGGSGAFYVSLRVSR